MSDAATFRGWYRAKFGHLHPAVQGTLWWFWGFLWIPIWYMRDRAAIASLLDARLAEMHEYSLKRLTDLEEASAMKGINEDAMIRELRVLCSRWMANEVGQDLVDRARAIGVELDRRGGMDRMRSVHRALGAIPGARTLDTVWNGIGHWRG